MSYHKQYYEQNKLKYKKHLKKHRDRIKKGLPKPKPYEFKIIVNDLCIYTEHFSSLNELSKKINLPYHKVYKLLNGGLNFKKHQFCEYYRIIKLKN